MTPHNNAPLGEIAKNVIMPGDPRRATLIAETFLENPKLVNDVRGNLAYTGKYKGKDVTVMSSGMGMASMGIYATELFKTYDVDRIIRVGTCGGLNKDIKLETILLAEKAYTASNFAYQLTGEEKKLISSSSSLNEKIIQNAKEEGINIEPVVIDTTDIFYTEYEDPTIDDMNVVATEMETFALLFLANHFEKEATSILTVSDNLVTKEKLSTEEREMKLKNAIFLALESL